MENKITGDCRIENLEKVVVDVKPVKKPNWVKRAVITGVAGTVLTVGTLGALVLGCRDNKEVHKPESNSGYAVGVDPVHLVFKIFYGGKENPVAVERNELMDEAYCKIKCVESHWELMEPLGKRFKIGSYNSGRFAYDFIDYSEKTGCSIQDFLDKLDKNPEKTIRNFVEAEKDRYIH